MKYRIEYISTFHADIIFIEESLKEYPKKATRVFAKADRLLRNLEDMPELYPVYYDAPAFRFIVVEDYLIFYKVIHDDKIIEVYRMLYGRMNMPEHL